MDDDVGPAGGAELTGGFVGLGGGVGAAREAQAGIVRRNGLKCVVPFRFFSF